MKKFNWVEVDDATDFERLPQGGYVLEITDVDDQPEYERLGVVFDVAEGEFAHKFANSPADMAWTHQINQSYKETAQRFFKGFLTALEKSNPGFSVAEWQKDSDERKLIGLKFGAVINYYHGVNEKGIVTRCYNLARALPVDKIRSGDFKVPDDRYSDDAKAQIEAEAAEKATGESTASTAGQKTIYSDCPF